MNIQQLADKYYQSFELKTRKNGERFYCVKDDCKDDQLTELIRTAHGDMMPDDYKYQYIHDALEAISEQSNDDNDYSPEPDIYTRDLLKWVSSNLTRTDYCNQAIEELGCTSFDSILTFGQILERQEVYQSVYQSLTEIVEGE